METMSNILQSFLTQNILGYLGIGLILVVISLGVIYNIRVKSKYERLIQDFEESNYVDVIGCEGLNKESLKRERKFLNSELKTIADDFKESAKKGTGNINTEVIIQKRLSNKILMEENICNTLPSISIALGLIGTFLGLTIAIMTTTGILSLGSQSMADFSRGMNAPLASMSSAFWTSIIGVIGSVALNTLNVRMKRAKEDFYDIFEDYLDNELFSVYSKNDKDVIEDVVNRLTQRLDDLFNKGINNLVNGVNRNTLDMTSTLKGMNNHMKDLDNLVSDFRISVIGIKTPIKNFGDNLENFSKMSSEFCRSVSVSSNKFGVNSNNLEKSLGELSKSMMDNRREMNKLCMRLEAQSNEVKKGYNTFSDAFKVIKEEQNKNNEVVSRQIDKLNNGYREFERGVSKFSDNVSNMKNEVANGIYYALQRETESISSSIVNKLDVPLRDISIATQELSRSTDKMREMGKVSNDWQKNDKEIGRC